MHANYLYIYIILIIFSLRTLKEELELAENNRREAKNVYNAVCEKEERTKSALNNVNTTLMKFKTLQRRCKEEIDNLKDKIESDKGTSADVFVSNTIIFLNRISLLPLQGNIAVQLWIYYTATRSHGSREEISSRKGYAQAFG